MLFSVSLAQKLGTKGLISVSLHPGVVGTQILRHDVDESVKALGENPLLQALACHRLFS